MQDELQAILENPCVLTILNNMTEYVYIVDEQGCLQFINPAVEAFENLTNSEVKGKHIKELYTQGESPTLKALYEQKTIPEHENIYMLDGKQYHQLAKSFPLFAGDKLLGVCTVQRDMTLVSQVLSDNTALQKNQQKNKTFDSLIGEHPAFQRSIELAKSSAVNDVPILLSGFTGSGKEVFAQAIHNSSPRKNKPFLAINCAAVPDGLLEGILFGTTKGSFTGAQDTPGLFELADGGTLFLDEINSMELDAQAKLLRVLEDNKIRRIGAKSEKTVDVRIIAAVNEEPEGCVESNKIREDLFYRLCVLRYDVPTLFERKGDIPLLAEHFRRHYNKKLHKQIIAYSEEVMEIFNKYDWPGNVRELKNVVESAFHNNHEAIITVNDIPNYILSRLKIDDLRKSKDFNLSLNEMISRYEQMIIEDAYERNHRSLTNTAKELQVSKQNLFYKMKKYEIR